MITEVIGGALAQGPRAGAAKPASRTPSIRAWEALGGASGKARTIRGRVLGSTVLPGAIKLAGRLGLGKLGTDLSLAEISRAGVRAMGEVVERLEIEADHVVFGHTHRRGPIAADVAGATGSEWSAAGARLHNSGSWVYAPAFIGTDGEASAFWPGTIIQVEDSDEPRSRGLLEGTAESEIRDALRERE